MPKLNLGINGVDQDAAQGREPWPADKLPPTGSYNGKLKVCQMTKAGPNAQNPGAHMLKIGVELVDSGKDWHGYTAFRNLVILDKTIPYINQFLQALTDGSDSEFEKIKKAFYESGPVVDDRQTNVLKIGKFKINSPDGQLPIKVSVTRGSFTPKGSDTPVPNASINSFLLSDAARSAADDDDEPAAEEEVNLGDDDETVADESVFDDDDAEEEASV